MEYQQDEKKVVLTISQTVGGKMPSSFKILIPLTAELPLLQTGDEVFCENIIVYELRGSIMFKGKPENIKLISRPLNQGTIEAEELFI